MSKRLKDKVAVGLGAGSSGPGWGHGKAAAVLFAREGAKIFAVDLRHRAAEETREIIAAEGGDATSFTTDVSKTQDIKSLVDAGIKVYGRIEVLLNNVGILVVSRASSLGIGRDVEHHRMQRSGIPYFRCEPGSSVSLSVNDPPIRSERRELAPLSTRITATGVVGFPIR
jgi:NAD(P)-dependent dehydrogenase (short-subunit alcohol dehydrogenase family)